MSRFQNQKIPCPTCGAAVDFADADSVNADRRADLRDDILSGDFQRGTCGQCRNSFRLDPELNYLDVARGQWIAASSLAGLGDWQRREAGAQEIFSKTYGEKAPLTAQEIGRTLQARLVFGWPALREKIYLLDHGLDDVELELTKIAVLRSQGGALSDDTEMRLLSIEGDEFRMAWIHPGTERIVELLGVPREVYDSIAADRRDWEPLRQAVSAGLFVDSQRLMI